jgi:hypothetical protein
VRRPAHRAGRRNFQIPGHPGRPPREASPTRRGDDRSQLAGHGWIPGSRPHPPARRPCQARATSRWAAPEDHRSPGRARAGSPLTGDAGEQRNFHPPCMRRSWPPGGTLAQYEQSHADPALLPGHSPFRPGAAGGSMRLRRQRIREPSVRRQSFLECRRSVGVRLDDVRLGGVVLRCRRAARITAGTHQHQAPRWRGS